MATDYRELLKQPAEEAIRISGPLPAGHYIGTMPTSMEPGNARSGTPRFRFPITLSEPCDDVDAGQLEGVAVEGRVINADYYITPQALGRLAKMVNGVLGAKPGTNLDERLPDLSRAKVMVHLGQRPSDTNPDDVFNEVISVIAAP